MTLPLVHYPYVSQWADPACNAECLAGNDPCDDAHWSTLSGFSDADLYCFWCRRICGIACFQSLLLHRRNTGSHSGLTVPSRYQLWLQALQAGAYVVRPDNSVQGLIYRPFVEMLAREYAISARVETAFSEQDLAHWLAQGRPVMASVSPKVRQARGINQDRQANGGHLVLCYALEQGNVWFNNPSGNEQAPYHSLLPLSVFYSWCAGRGIVF